jgi:hypothetical protein
LRDLSGCWIRVYDASMRMMSSRLVRKVGVAAGLGLVGAFAQAQSAASPASLVQPRQAYERAVAACQAGQLPAPQRDACIREAGLALDRARLGPGAVPEVTTTPDGRATVVPNVPPGPGVGAGSSAAGTGSPSAPQSPDEAGTVVSPDGRSRVVVPTDGAVPGRTE